jgi:hypothetical protein
LAKVGETFAQYEKAELALNGFGTFDIGRLDATVITQPLTQVFHQGPGCLLCSRHIGQRLRESHRQVKDKLTEQQEAP